MIAVLQILAAAAIIVAAGAALDAIRIAIWERLPDRWRFRWRLVCIWTVGTKTCVASRPYLWRRTAREDLDDQLWKPDHAWVERWSTVPVDAFVDTDGKRVIVSTTGVKVLP